VQLGDSPTGYESLYYSENSCDVTSCGHKVIGSLVSASFVNGIASFEKLILPTAGTGYTLKFIGRKSQSLNEELFAMTYTDPFEVTVGDVYKLYFYNFTGNAFGGTAFASNPIVTTTDRGGNTDTTISGIDIEATLTNSPNGTEQLLPVSKRTVTLQNGEARFSGLYINEAGFPYQITFTAKDTSLPTLTTNNFTVAIGKPAQLEFVDGDSWLLAPKYSGEFFTVAPRLRLLDVGGNFVHSDNTSGIGVFIKDNSYGAVVVSTDYISTDNYRDYDNSLRWASLIVQAEAGIATFNALKISKQGVNYTLGFTLYEYSKYTDTFSDLPRKTHSELPVELRSAMFHVGYGPPRKLLITTAAGDAWAGNQAFATQPIVQAVDYSDNPVLSDFTSICHASVVQSLSVGSAISIYTAYAPQTTIARVTTNVTSGVTAWGK
jgi:hypothetical protein